VISNAHVGLAGDEKEEKGPSDAVLTSGEAVNIFAVPSDGSDERAGGAALAVGVQGPGNKFAVDIIDGQGRAPIQRELNRMATSARFHAYCTAFSAK